MERITFKGNFCDISMCRENPCPYNGICSQRQTWERLKEYEDTGMEPEDLKKAFNETAILKLAAQAISTTPDHLRDLLHAEQDGRLVVLPCKAGNLIYVGRRPAIITQFFGYVRERYFHAVFCDKNEGIDIPFEELGKTVFLTREEAEAALKGGEEHRENRPD